MNLQAINKNPIELKRRDIKDYLKIEKNDFTYEDSINQFNKINKEIFEYLTLLAEDKAKMIYEYSRNMITESEREEKEKEINRRYRELIGQRNNLPLALLCHGYSLFPHKLICLINDKRNDSEYLDNFVNNTSENLKPFREYMNLTQENTSFSKFAKDTLNKVNETPCEKESILYSINVIGNMINGIEPEFLPIVIQQIMSAESVSKNRPPINWNIVFANYYVNNKDKFIGQERK